MWKVDLIIIKSNFEQDLCEPYCSFVHKGTTYKTDIDHETNTPRWNKKFTLNGEAETFQNLRFEVCKSQRPRDGYIGTATISLLRQVKQKGVEKGIEHKPLDLLNVLPLYEQKKEGYSPGPMTGTVKIRTIITFQNDIPEWHELTKTEIYGQIPPKENQRQMSISVAVRKAKEIVMASSKNETANSLVKIEFGKKTLFTKPQNDTNFPKWNENFQFVTDMNEFAPKMHLELRDTKSVLGELNFSIYELLRENFTEKTEYVILKWFALPQGKIKLGFRINFDETVDFEFLRQLCGLSPFVPHPLFDPERDEKIWGLRITVSKAVELPCKKESSLDPYCKFAIGEKVFQTTPQKSTANPVWEETFMGTDEYTKLKQLNVEIWDKNQVTKSTAVGNVKIKPYALLRKRVGEIRNGTRIFNFEEQYPVTQHTDTRKVIGGKQGTVYFTIRIEIPPLAHLDSVIRLVAPPSDPEPKFSLTDATAFGLSLTIIKAQGLPPADVSGFSDPYCKIQFLKRIPLIETPPSALSLDNTNAMLPSQQTPPKNETDPVIKTGPKFMDPKKFAKTTQKKMKATQKQLKKQMKLDKKEQKKKQKQQAKEEKKTKKGNELKTKVIKKTLNPTWNETFQHQGTLDSATKILITIIDWDRFSSDDFLGTVELGIKKLFRKSYVDGKHIFVTTEWFDIRGKPDPKHGGYSAGGKLKLRLQLELSPSLLPDQAARLLGIVKTEPPRRMPEAREKKTNRLGSCDDFQTGRELAFRRYIGLLGSFLYL
eukprot:Anaeramoba_ignava/c21832_g1_i3.p1 GENE.c21832_g1_i3~~c21832_g1_i3.p1  ORF type:complete len:767 (+),score=195.98 c21832_g1_i3:23-2323(+)